MIKWPNKKKYYELAKVPSPILRESSLNVLAFSGINTRLERHLCFILKIKSGFITTKRILKEEVIYGKLADKGNRIKSS